MNILTDRLPDAVTVDGSQYPIHTDFRTWIIFEGLISDNTAPMMERMLAMIELCYIEHPEPSIEAVMALLGFYMGDRRQGQGDGVNKAGKPNYSFEHDAEYIYAAFQTQYHIDLQKADLHWYQFKALFAAISDDTMFGKILSYRGMDLSKIKDKEQKSFYRRMKALYRLPDNRTPEQIERDMISEMENLF